MPSSSSSSASPIEYSPYGREGIGVVQPQSGSDFPLVGVPSADVRYLLADAHLSYDDPADYTPTLVEYCPPFRIAWLYGLGTDANAHPSGYPNPTHDVDIIVVDCNNCIVFDSTTADRYFEEEWTERLAIYGWETDDAMMFIVVHTTWAETADPNIVPTTYAVNILPEHAVLDERTIERRPKRVKSFTVVLDNYTKTEVDFVEGFNMGITHEGEVFRGDGLRIAQRILFDATAGNGLGIFPGCEPEPALVRRINNVSPTANGDFFIGATDCYHIRQPSSILTPSPRVASMTPSTLAFGNDCVPCCDCPDYVAAAEYLNRTRNTYKKLGTQLESIRDLYHDNRDRFLESKCCFERFPLRLVVQPQRCPYVDVGAQFCNMSDDCVGPVQLTICVEIIGAGITGSAGFLSSASINLGSSSSACQPVSFEVPGFTHIRGQSYKSPRRTSETERYAMGGAHPCYIAYWDFVEATQSIWVRFRLGFDCCGTDADDNPLFVRLTLTGQAGDPLGSALSPILVPVCGPGGASLSAEEAVAIDQTLLRCPTNPNDQFEVCPGENHCADAPE